MMIRSILLLALGFVAPLPAFGARSTAPILLRPSTQASVETTLLALEEFTNSRGEKALTEFANEHLTEAYVQVTPKAELFQLLENIRNQCRNAGGIMIQGAGEHRANMLFDTQTGHWQISVSFDPEQPTRIAHLSLGQAPEKTSIEAFQWDEVAERLTEYEQQGFAGSVLLVRDGTVFLQRGYGMADPEPGIPNKSDTIFAIGSVPIDFTKAAILWLEEHGQLSTADPIRKFFPELPQDKRAITIEHLMTGQSGLPNFHGIRGVDEDLDLSYIDRAEAMRRIFATPLLFQPGQSQEHSHSAWGVLAAIVEICSKQTYGEFLYQHFFVPADMQRTRLYQDCAEFAPEELACGAPIDISANPVATHSMERNTAQHWGPTSWLVMGSGGMVSTTVDIERWLAALHAGKLLGSKSLKKFWSGGIMAGGNDRGFACIYNEGPDTYSIVCSNSHTGSNDLSLQIGEALAMLCLQSHE